MAVHICSYFNELMKHQGPWNVTLKQLSVPSNLQIGKLQQQVVVIVEIKSNLQTHADRVELSMTNGIKIAIKAEQREPRLMGNDDNCCDLFRYCKSNEFAWKNFVHNSLTNSHFDEVVKAP
uniref:Uncharacterized protein n=1 Tax=Glossina morsitans morsitans TaxID=37546 RepID=A0A1B0G025_GLOMM